MFQYAFYKYLESRCKYVYLDVSYYDYYRSHTGYDLDSIFNLNINVSYIKDLLSFKYRAKFPGLNKVLGCFNNVLIRQSEFAGIDLFNDDSCAKNNTYRFDGLWQDEAFFRLITAEILQDFSFKNVLGFKDNSFADMISCSNSVSIHIRRGDYLKSQKHNVVNLNYVYTAVAFIRTEVSNPSFFIFSDDLQWVKDNLVIENSHFVDASDDCHPAIDMYLMSQCKHNIISNSTFSWWGAYLNKNSDKVVCAPYIWTRGVSSATFVPSSWRRIVF